jgi:hypothetical protein
MRIFCMQERKEESAERERASKSDRECVKGRGAGGRVRESVRARERESERAKWFRIFEGLGEFRNLHNHPTMNST